MHCQFGNQTSMKTVSSKLRAEVIDATQMYHRITCGGHGGFAFSHQAIFVIFQKKNFFNTI